VIAKLKKKNNLRTFEKIISDQQINEIPITLYKSKSRSNTTPFCSRKNFDGIYLENFKTSKSLKNRLDNQIEYYCINQKQLYENQKYSYKAKESQTQKEKENLIYFLTTYAENKMKNFLSQLIKIERIATSSIFSLNERALIIHF